MLLNFLLNKKLDKQMALYFLSVKAGGVDFSQGVVGVHPELKPLLKLRSNTRKKEVISAHFDRFYRQHASYLRRRIKESAAEWRKVEAKFLAAVGKIVPGSEKKQTRCRAYLSIIDCNPRFLKSRSFQFFYAHPLGIRYVAAHEWLHFIFYDYARKRFPETFGKLDPDEGIFWDTAEIFNAIVLHLPVMVVIHGVRRTTAYPDHKKYLPGLKRVWDKNKSADKLIIAILKRLEKGKRDA